MKQKWLLQLAALILAVVFSVINWLKTDSSQKDGSTTTQQSSQSSAKPKQTPIPSSEKYHLQNEQNYDFEISQDPIGANPHAPVDYYMLALSWSPAFCQQQQQNYGEQLPSRLQMQCGSTQQYGWVIHGLWPQNANARSVTDHPRLCKGDLPMLDYRLIQPYLAESPSANLLQAEWEKHGACAFEQPTAYFQKQQQLYRSLRLPEQQMDKKELFRWLKQANPQLKNVYLAASRTELFICYSLNWQPIDCK